MLNKSLEEVDANLRAKEQAVLDTQEEILNGEYEDAADMVRHYFMAERDKYRAGAEYGVKRSGEFYPGAEQQSDFFEALLQSDLPIQTGYLFHEEERYHEIADTVNDKQVENALREKGLAFGNLAIRYAEQLSRRSNGE